MLENTLLSVSRGSRGRLCWLMWHESTTKKQRLLEAKKRPISRDFHTCMALQRITCQYLRVHHSQADVDLSMVGIRDEGTAIKYKDVGKAYYCHILYSQVAANISFALKLVTKHVHRLISALERRIVLRRTGDGKRRKDKRCVLKSIAVLCSLPYHGAIHFAAQSVLCITPRTPPYLE